MSDASRHNILAVRETVYGVTPTSPALRAVRHTSVTLGLTKEIIKSEELRADRQIADSRHGAKQTGGDIGVELSYGSFDDFLEATLCGTWAVKFAPFVAITISALAADNSLNISSGNFPALEAGDVIAVTGFTGVVGNNAQFKVVSNSGTKLIVEGSTLVNDAAGESVTITTLTQQLKAGVQRRSYSMLRHFTDQQSADKPYHLFTGVEFNKFVLSVSPNAIVKATFSTIGKGQTLAQTAPAGATYPAATTSSPMDAFSGSIKENGNELAVVTELSLTLENGLEARFVVGSDTTQLPSIGRSMLSGNSTVYFENSAVLEKFINETESALEFTVGDVAGNGYRFLMPRVKYNGGQPDVSGQGSITLAMPWEALYDADAESQLVVEKSPALS